MFLNAPQLKAGPVSGVPGPLCTPGESKHPPATGHRDRSTALDDTTVLQLYDWLNRRQARLFGTLRQCDRQDAVDETFVQALGFAPKLRNPVALRSASLTIALRIRARLIYAYIHERSGDRPVEPVVSWHPEKHLYEKSRRKRAFAAIAGLRSHEREILRRFYFDEEKSEQIRAELQLTETQFRLRKTRAIKKAGSRAQLMEVARRPPSFTASRRRGVSGL